MTLKSRLYTLYDFLYGIVGMSDNIFRHYCVIELHNIDMSVSLTLFSAWLISGVTYSMSCGVEEHKDILDMVIAVLHYVE